VKNSAAWHRKSQFTHVAGIVADELLQDPRPAHTSHTVMRGESPHEAGRVLGRRRVGMTNRSVHLDDATPSHAPERVAVTIKRKLQ
jgi:hypothetical protein